MIQTQAELEHRLVAGQLSDWGAAAYVELRDKIADPSFPCTFGAVALKKGDILFAFIESTDEAVVLDGLATALTAYARFVAGRPAVQASMKPLAVCMPPPPGWHTLEDYFQHSWRLLQAVHERDPRPWPERIARDPDDPRWSFCFEGVPFFVNFKTPCHQERHSRRTRHSYLWLVQARDGFDIVAGDTPQGHNARRIIREKLAAYDAVPIYPALAHYGSADNREWKQYFLPDDNSSLAPTCPFHPVG
jgi:FPC/CPF motif-containing protein YcgG